MEGFIVSFEAKPLQIKPSLKELGNKSNCLRNNEKRSLRKKKATRRKYLNVLNKVLMRCKQTHLHLGPFKMSFRPFKKSEDAPTFYHVVTMIFMKIAKFGR